MANERVLEGAQGIGRLWPRPFPAASGHPSWLAQGQVHEPTLEGCRHRLQRLIHPPVQFDLVVQRARMLAIAFCSAMGGKPVGVLRRMPRFVCGTPVWIAFLPNVEPAASAPVNNHNRETERRALLSYRRLVSSDSANQDLVSRPSCGTQSHCGQAVPPLT